MQNLKELFKTLNQEQKTINAKAREAIVEFLRSVPGHKVSLTDNPAYSLIEGADGWLEETIYGIMLKEDTLYFSVDTYLDENDEDIASWDPYDLTREDDNYISVNWLSVLEAISKVKPQ